MSNTKFQEDWPDSCSSTNNCIVQISDLSQSPIFPKYVRYHATARRGNKASVLIMSWILPCCRVESWKAKKFEWKICATLCCYSKCFIYYEPRGVLVRAQTNNLLNVRIPRTNANLLLEPLCVSQFLDVYALLGTVFVADHTFTIWIASPS